jgi:hypothetical protein
MVVDIIWQRKGGGGEVTTGLMFASRPLFFCHSHGAMIRLYDKAGNVIATQRAVVAKSTKNARFWMTKQQDAVNKRKEGRRSNCSDESGYGRSENRQLTA